ncbi:MAG: LptF/LptG family permease [Candidatus Aminicenantes bacterium]|nr:MAG: LptF/LptG family permease [Candidatus Aminicenantes bacterium]
MYKFFDRYVIKEIVPPFLIGILIFTFVLLMNQILQLSEIFITRGVSFKAVVEIFVYLIPAVLAFTVPMAVLTGILAGLSRLSSDSEIIALKTLGISYKRLLRPVLIFSLGGWLIASYLTLYLAPRSNYKWVQSLSQSVLAKVQFKINPREFNESIPNMVLFIQDITQDNNWENIFVYFSDPPEEPRVILAKKGKLNFYPEIKRATLELLDGSLHSYALATPEKYSVTSFQRLVEDINVEGLFSSISAERGVREKDIKELFSEIKVIKEDLEKKKKELEEMNEMALKTEDARYAEASFAYSRKRKDHISHWVEVHKKFAFPFACLIFGILGLPLGVSTKKGGRTSGFTVSLGIILLYYVLITAGEKMAMDAKLSPWLGIWGPNILLIVIAFYLFINALKESSVLPSFLRLAGKRGDIQDKPKKRRFSRSWIRLSLRFPNILDRYITRKYLFIFLLVFFSLLSISILVTFLERLDNIYKNDKPLSLLFDYIWYRIPDFTHYILPITALATTLLALGLLTKFNEITAMKACGISLYRIIFPVLLLGAIISLFSFYLQENVLPYSNKKVEETWNKINDIPPRSYSYLDRRWVMGKEKDRIYRYYHFDVIASAFSQLYIYDIDPSTWKFKRRIYSDKGYLSEDRLSLVDCWFRDFVDDEPVGFEMKKNMDLSQVENKSYFVKEWKEPDQMSYGELRQYISEIEERGFETVKFKVDLNYKLSFPLVAFIMTLLGIPFAFSMGKRGALTGIGLSIVIAMVYWGTIGTFRSLGYVNYLHDILAAWGPNLIFGLLGLYLIFASRT